MKNNQKPYVQKMGIKRNKVTIETDYGMQFFTRFSENPKGDLKRGFSFVGYMLKNSPEDLAEMLGWEDYEIAEPDDNPSWLAGKNIAARDPKTRKWGAALPGLCGFGPFDTVEEAEACDGDSLYGLEAYPFKAIFEGVDTTPTDIILEDGASTFRPVKIIKIISK